MNNNTISLASENALENLPAADNTASCIVRSIVLMCIDYYVLTFRHKKSFKIPKGNRKSKDRVHNGQKKKRQTTIYKTAHINLTIEIHEPH